MRVVDCVRCVIGGVRCRGAPLPLLVSPRRVFVYPSNTRDAEWEGGTFWPATCTAAATPPTTLPGACSEPPGQPQVRIASLGGQVWQDTPLWVSLGGRQSCAATASIIFLLNRLTGELACQLMNESQFRRAGVRSFVTGNTPCQPLCISKAPMHTHRVYSSDPWSK